MIVYCLYMCILIGEYVAVRFQAVNKKRILSASKNSFTISHPPFASE